MQQPQRLADRHVSDVWHDERTGEAIVGDRSVPVRTVLDLLAVTSPEDLARARPDLSQADIQAALRYAAEVPLVDLNDYEGLGLVVQRDTGVRYSNQTGGGSVHHPELEGLFIPLPDPRRGIARRLTSHFTGPKWRGGCDRGIDDETARFIDGLIGARYWIGPLHVDRDQLQRSEEAWIWVRLGDPDDVKKIYGERIEPSLHGVRDARAVLTWPNSD